jgi:hypothetical protein
MPVSAASLQHGSQICLATLIKNHKIAKNSTTTKAQIWNPYNFRKKFDAFLTIKQLWKELV